jgi:hypothetical protein
MPVTASAMATTVTRSRMPATAILTNRNGFSTESLSDALGASVGVGGVKFKKLGGAPERGKLTSGAVQS